MGNYSFNPQSRFPGHSAESTEENSLRSNGILSSLPRLGSTAIQTPNLLHQRQEFIAVFKAKNRGTAIRQNTKNRGNFAVEIVKIAVNSRSKLQKSR